MKITQCKYT